MYYLEYLVSGKWKQHITADGELITFDTLIDVIAASEVLHAEVGDHVKICITGE